MEAKYNQQVDGGWGWMVVLGATINQFLLGGWNRSYGFFYVKIRQRFESSAATTALAGGISAAILLGGGERYCIVYSYLNVSWLIGIFNPSCIVKWFVYSFIVNI